MLAITASERWGSATKSYVHFLLTGPPFWKKKCNHQFGTEGVYNKIFLNTHTGLLICKFIDNNPYMIQNHAK